MTSPTDLARAEAEKLLPCDGVKRDACWRDSYSGGTIIHWSGCPARHHEPVAQALAALIVERDAVRYALNLAVNALESRAMEESATPHHLRCSICHVDDDNELGPQHANSCSISIWRALRRPDAPANTEMPGESICQTCKGTGQILYMWDRPGGGPGNGYGPCPACKQYATPEEIAAADTLIATPTIEELRAKVVEAATSLWQDNRDEEWLQPLYAAVDEYRCAK